jgi:hypothetical protein
VLAEGVRGAGATMVGTTFITPATVATWDDGKRSNFADHVSAKVRKSADLDGAQRGCGRGEAGCGSAARRASARQGARRRRTAEPQRVAGMCAARLSPLPRCARQHASPWRRPGSAMRRDACAVLLSAAAAPPGRDLAAAAPGLRPCGCVGSATGAHGGDAAGGAVQDEAGSGRAAAHGTLRAPPRGYGWQHTPRYIYICTYMAGNLPPGIYTWGQVASQSIFIFLFLFIRACISILIFIFIFLFICK